MTGSKFLLHNERTDCTVCVRKKRGKPPLPVGSPVIAPKTGGESLPAKEVIGGRVPSICGISGPESAIFAGSA